MIQDDENPRNGQYKIGNASRKRKQAGDYFIETVRFFSMLNLANDFNDINLTLSLFWFEKHFGFTGYLISDVEFYDLFYFNEIYFSDIQKSTYLPSAKNVNTIINKIKNYIEETKIYNNKLEKMLPDLKKFDPNRDMIFKISELLNKYRTNKNTKTINFYVKYFTDSYLMDIHTRNFDKSQDCLDMNDGNANELPKWLVEYYEAGYISNRVVPHLFYEVSYSYYFKIDSKRRIYKKAYSYKSQRKIFNYHVKKPKINTFQHANEYRERIDSLNDDYDKKMRELDNSVYSFSNLGEQEQIRTDVNNGIDDILSIINKQGQRDNLMTKLQIEHKSEVLKKIIQKFIIDNKIDYEALEIEKNKYKIEYYESIKNIIYEYIESISIITPDEIYNNLFFNTNLSIYQMYCQRCRVFNFINELLENNRIIFKSSDKVNLILNTADE